MRSLRFCIPAVLAAVLLLQPCAFAHAAGPLRDGTASSSGTEEQAETESAVDELEDLVKSLLEQVTQLQTLSTEAHELGQALEEARAAAVGGADEIPASEDSVDEGLSALDSFISLLQESIEELKAQSTKAKASVSEAQLAPAAPAAAR